MSTRKFDRYMVAIGAGRHVKFRRLTVPERYAFFMGVLSVAAQAPVRGCLLVGSLNAEAADIAAEADVPEKVAQSALAKLRQIGVVYHDDALGCERVHDFEEQWNPAPKHDPTNAERQRRHRAKLTAGRNGTVTPDSNAAVTPPEVEGEVEEKKPPQPPAERGEPGHIQVASPGKGLRANGTNPRAVAAQQAAADAANRSATAVAALTEPTDEHRERWARLRNVIERSMSDTPAWPLYAEGLELAGVDGDVLVIDGPVESWSWSRAKAVIASRAESCGVAARLATADEHNGRPVTPEAVRALLLGGEAA
jgi:hypothetical protein